MNQAIANAAFLILLGVLWRWQQPFGLAADQMRQSLTTLVYVLMLPALVLSVLWQAPLGLDTLYIILIAISCILSGLFLAWLWFHWRGVPNQILGTVLLAAGWGNFTYLGLPVLEGSLGAWARSIAIQFDLFAATPLLLTLGIVLASHFGKAQTEQRLGLELLKVPPIWAALLGVVLNLSGIPLTEWIKPMLDSLAQGVIPLMLFATGLALRWESGFKQRLGYALPVIAIRLLLLPMLALFLALGLELENGLRTAVVLEAAMPSMVLGLVLCDRYQLDTSLYAEIIVLSTAAAMIALPLWFSFLYR